MGLLTSRIKEIKEIRSKDFIIPALEGGICEVQFYKADGTLRVMKATLNKDIIYSNGRKEETDTAYPKKDKKPIKEDLIILYDVESSAWRSFKISRMLPSGFKKLY